MALIKCPECSTQVSDKAASCPSCGYPLADATPVEGGVQAQRTPAQVNYPPTVKISKSRGAYIILGILFGYIGFHNFYSGHNLRGAVKFGVFILTFALDASTRFYTGFSIVAMVIFALWSLIEIVTVKNDAAGYSMS
ncbi:TM2 domain-containing protein [Ideonella sp. 4Y11]|uniref:TM2 domain-containing protein n=1 Tax=Ideonella aquatica TaxID=2824119 RepID=A0A941BKW9_9BURK|nr:TM2 domain-containing protein [Ideonella aquatica]MBQ0960343.1 TM2 domain-containing protein [Ideonella aquatica]